MKVKLTQGRVGAHPELDADGKTTGAVVTWAQDPGEEIDVPDEEGKRLIARRMAKPVAELQRR